ncbi:APC family permease [Desulfoluna butyratoxydans]|uniref:Amino acid/polyamine transporter i n=1 Tax=Desulfoluna butyratoxydans TaxID=231438 RepID=A0A4U8YGK0_9BACT|nr:APC family permease [Desulfoluna butyratoxydans]VFQ42495.1 amino acid/polyamine transporter i [Desulfoluna butyratoxydans]
MPKEKMGPLQLSGLITGAVLGSGIILLPPMAQANLGQWAVMAWLIMMALGAVFAGLFAKMALHHPGPEGVPIAVRKAFGQLAGYLASVYMICAVCVGPVAVLMTAADAMARTFGLSPDSLPALSAGLLLFCMVLLTRKITILGAVVLSASLCIGIILTAGSLATIAATPMAPWPDTPWDLSAMGRTLLVLFWAIVGWEVIGNYTMDVRNPSRTIPQATALGVTGISGIYLLVAWAVFTSSANHPVGENGTMVSVAQVVRPLFGTYAEAVVMVVTSALCVCTVLLIVGGVSRLMATLARDSHMPGWLSRNTKNRVPVAALTALACFHGADLLLLHFKWVSLEQLVTVANVFFLANSLMAVAAAIRLFPSMALRVPCLFLFTGFIALLCFSAILPLMGLAAITVCVVCNHARGDRQPNGLGVNRHTRSS